MNKILKILLVEDDRLSQTVGKLYFREIGSTLDIAASGKEALALANTNTYDFIFMDIGLADIDGFEVAAAIRQSGGINAKTPIITLTAHGDIESRNQAVLIGMNEYLVKPLTMDKIQNVIGHFYPDFLPLKNSELT